MKLEVIEDKVAVRVYPGIHEKLNCYLNKGDTVNYIKKQGNWVKHNKGWSLQKDNKTTYLRKFIDPNTTTSEGSTTAEDPNASSVPNERDERIGDIDYSGYRTSVTSGSYTHFIKNVRGIHGMPYQFMSSVDRRLPDSGFGRKYTSKIISRVPLLLITPGMPEFMDGFSKKQKNDILTHIATGMQDEVLSSLLENEDGKFYSFKFAYNEYYAYVNPMLQKVARYLNIQDEPSPDGTPLDRYEWENYANSSLKNFVSSAEVVAFYLDSDTQISESFSNNTGESALSSSMKSLSDMGREITYLMGGVSGELYEKVSGNAQDALASLDDFTSKYNNILPIRIIDKLKQGAQVVVGGGNLIFPERWDSSDFSRSYDISLKLRTPDGDKFSWFMNIAVPLIHLIALSAPHQLGVNGYQSPFLIRAFYKGFFNVDMGMVTSLSINKGDKGKWTLDGLPTEVDINMNIKDLYQILTISDDSDLSGILSNTALLDYLANMCGVNVNKPDILRSIDLYYTQVTNSLWDKVTFDGFLKAQQALDNMLSNMLT